MDLVNRTHQLLCLVSLPDRVLAVEVDRNADGKEVLTAACQMVGTVETDFFGLQYTSSCGETLWLNLRNRLTSELTGSAPFRLKLNVKFHVQMHFIQQEVTRNLFYLNVRQDYLDGTLRVDSMDSAVHLASLLARAERETRSSADLIVTPRIPSFLPSVYRTPECIDSVVRNCEQLKVSCQSAQKSFLREVMKLDTYGMHLHHAHMDDLNECVHIGVGPNGIALFNRIYSPIYCIPYSALQRATCDGLFVDVTIHQDDGSSLHNRLTLSTRSSANALYRDLTEMCSFFHFDTVESAVAEQSCRNLPGLILSLFNERSNMGKKYVFDIERTLQEAYDHARRILYARDGYLGGSETKVKVTESADESVMDTPTSCDSKQHLKVVQKLLEIADALTCHVCKDAEISTVFIPCGHVVCCDSCARRLPSCPVCKQVVDAVQVIFLPSARPVIAPMIQAACVGIETPCN